MVLPHYLKAGKLGPVSAWNHLTLRSSNRKATVTWTTRRKSGVAVGMLVHQDGDREGRLLFDPLKADQAKLAIQVAA